MRIGVVGAGTMGSGIAQVAAFHGHQVYLCDMERSSLERAVRNIEKSLGRIVRKMDAPDQDGRLGNAVHDVLLPAEAHLLQWGAGSCGRGVARPGGGLSGRTLQLIETGTEREVLAESDFVIEAVFEDFTIKQEVFRQLDRICREGVVLASNTSSISITRLAACTGRPEAVVGMHFMNPVPVMRLVEIIRGLESSDSTLQKTRDLTLNLDKVPVEVKDFPGFVANRVLLPMLNEAMFVVMEGIAEVEAVDQVMKLGMNHPLGPLQLADLIGLDVCLDILNVLFEGYRDSKYRPCPLLQQMVDAGRLGRKSGRGFYEYSDRKEGVNKG